ncbi:3-dehydroquinate synthase family protein [Candidatus Poriferisodalis sp.]|uniref:3-dehydroquinate synthase family protein n=1 Tax=Candidatus Poriferisodalis sp. TaxID=3101277 RepID=UPI003B026209
MTAPATAPIIVVVPLGKRSYPVLVGEGVRAELSHVMPPEARRAALVTQRGIEVEVDPGVAHRTFTIPDGEHAKQITTVQDLCSGFARFGLTRQDVVLAVGGGVVTDVAGFAAAVYHRGVAVVHVPTTLLGQIDAAVGGKTGVNLPEGKNLIGAYWQPSAVLCDTAVLDTLPARELLAGYGELAKYHFIGCSAQAAALIGPQRVAHDVQWPAGDAAPGAADVSPGANGTAGRQASPLGRCRDRLVRRGLRGDELRSRLAAGVGLADLERPELVAACVAVKAEVVGADETEGGRRALLNYGHTLGHALETAGHFDLRHGEAVAVGLRYAALVARRLGRIDDERVAEHERVLAAYGLETALPQGIDHDEIIELFGRDKKSVDGITFVLDGPDGLEVVPRIDPAVLRDALEGM